MAGTLAAIGNQLAQVGLGAVAGGMQTGSTMSAAAQQGVAMADMAAMAQRAMEMELFKGRLEEMKGLTKGVAKQIEDAGNAAKQG